MPATRNPTLRYATPVVLLIALVGGITWITQSLPAWRRPAGAVVAAKPADASQGVLKFTPPPGLPVAEDSLQAVWDADPVYALESEKLVEGHYYFPFKNVLGAPAEFEMESVSCDCTHADVAWLPVSPWAAFEQAWAVKPWAPPPFAQEPAWIKFTKNEHKGIAVPPDGHGVLRITWNGRKGYGELLNLSLKFWSQPEGDVAVRRTIAVRVPVRMVPPLLYDPTQASVGLLGTGQSVRVPFNVWSATRSDPDVAFGPADKPDPLFAIESRKLTEQECRELQEQLTQKKVLTRVRCGYRVTVTVAEQKDGRQMDLGPFQHAVPIQLDQLPLEITPPQVTGTIRGPVSVGGEGDQGKVQFRTFSAADPKTVPVPIYADPALKLEVAEFYPPRMQVDFKRNAKGSTAQRAQWDLKVTAPAESVIGPFPRDSRVVLRIVGDPPRLVRIPIVGIGTR